MGVASSLGLISGINYEELVSKLISLERRPVTILENRKTGIKEKIGALNALSIKLSSLKSAAKSLNDVNMFNTRSVEVTSSGTEAYLTATASPSAAVGSYNIYVDQLAQAHKIASQGWADENSAPILDSALYPNGGDFSFRIGDSGAITDINITASTTLQEMKDMINAANTGVNAIILNDGTDINPYRMVLTSENTGEQNDIQITTNVTQLDFTNNIIEAATSDTTNSGSYTGAVTSNTSEYYTGTTNKTYIIETMVAGTVGGAGTAGYRYSTDGGITWNDNDGNGFKFYTGALTTIGSTDGTNNTGNTENVKVQFTDSGEMSVGDTFRVDVFNPTLNEAKDAVIRVDSLTLIKDSNTISDVIDGVTLNLIKAGSTTINTVTVSQGDIDSAKLNIENFVTAYNLVIEDLHKAFDYDPDNPTDNPLRGDYTVRGIQFSLKDIVTNIVPGLTGDSTTLYQIGISTDITGKLSINNNKLSNALDADPLSVMKLFVEYGTPTDSAITYESKTSATRAGKYSIYIYTPPAQAAFESSEVIGSGGITDNETLTFTYTDEATEAVPTVTAFTVNLSAGETINNVVSKLNSKFATEEVGLTAINDGGTLKITSTDYGTDIKFTLVSDKDSAGQTGVGTTMHTKIGTDVVGTINGHAAVGRGKYLTGITGFDEAGLRISTTATTAGGKGHIHVSSGIASQLSTLLDSVTNPGKGTIASRNNALQDIIDDIDKQIEVKEDRLEDMEERLRKQFVRLEVLLSSLQVQAEFLSSQLNSLPQLYMSGR
jgi:flagellar hook-associated protein 2